MHTNASISGRIGGPAVQALPRMRVQQWSPSEVLKPFVRTYLRVESATGTVNRLLPDTSIVLAFRLQGRTEDRATGNGSLPQAAITGITRGARLMAYDPGTANLLVIFHEGGAAAFFGAALHALKGGTAPLHDLLPRGALADVEDALHEAPNDRARIRIIERFLLTRLRPQRTDALVNEAIRRIRQSQGTVRVTALAADLCISVDAFEKRFRATTGTSPKHFASIVRFRSMLARPTASADLLSLAYDGAFYDQSHFNAAFKRFTGLTPRQFFAQGDHW